MNDSGANRAAMDAAAAHPAIMSVAGANRAALLLALSLGILGDNLMRAPGPPGLNVTFWAGAGVLAVLLLRLRQGGLQAAVAGLLTAALLFATAMAWRDAPALRAMNLLLAAGLAAGAGGVGAGAWLTRAGAVDYLAAGSRSALAVAVGTVAVVSGAPLLPASPRWSRPALSVLRGALLAVPLLLVLGSLLAAADPVFAALASDAFAFDPGEVLSHLLLIGILAWGSAGYLGRFLTAEPAAAPNLRLPRPQVGVLDGAVALGLLNALFLAFVAVQLRYLFGGADLVRVTPGLGYADYARRGFFELVTVAALVVPLLLLADWSMRRRRFAEEWLFRGLASGQVLLVFAILASAVFRMRMYWQAYGLTELRLYASAFMIWVALVLGWVVLTVLRGRRRHFAFGALCAGLAVALSLDLVNPQDLIVKVNSGRVAAGQEYDVAYAGQLSADAVPALLSSLELIHPAPRCRLAGRLLERWGSDRPGGWRTFNYGDWRARRVVAEARAALAAIACPVAAAPGSGGK